MKMLWHGKGGRTKFRKGRKPNQVKSPLTGMMVDGSNSINGSLPAGHRPRDYDHGPSEKAKQRMKRHG